MEVILNNVYERMHGLTGKRLTLFVYSGASENPKRLLQLKNSLNRACESCLAKHDCIRRTSVSSDRNSVLFLATETADPRCRIEKSERMALVLNT